MDTVNSSKEKLDALISLIEENKAQVGIRYSKFTQQFSVTQNTEYKKINDSFFMNYNNWIIETDNIVKLLKSRKFEDAKKIYYSKYYLTFDPMRDAMDKFTEINLADSKIDYHESSKIYGRIQLVSFIILIISAVVVIVSGLVVSRSITIPLSQAVDITKAVANGNLTGEINTEGKDETSEVLKSINRMSAKMNEIITTIREGSNYILQSSRQLGSASEQLATGANQQASSTEEISALIEEMVATIEQNNDNAQSTKKIARNAADKITESLKSAKMTMDAMEEISEKIKTINEIAFITNILALNAAVEAARAGQYGKGFAVVALEVRKLAEKSKFAADEIQMLSTSCLQIAGDSEKLLSKIAPEVQKTAELIQNIALASSEQHAGVNQISIAVQGLNKVTQQNSATSEELSAGATELTSQADVLRNVVSYFVLK